MAEKVGEIYYDIDLDTAQIIAANQKARQELDNLGNQAKGAAAGVKTLETQMKTSALSANFCIPDIPATANVNCYGKKSI